MRPQTRGNLERPRRGRLGALTTLGRAQGELIQWWWQGEGGANQRIGANRAIRRRVAQTGTRFKIDDNLAPIGLDSSAILADSDAKTGRKIRIDLLGAKPLGRIGARRLASAPWPRHMHIYTGAKPHRLSQILSLSAWRARRAGRPPAGPPPPANLNRSGTRPSGRAAGRTSGGPAAAQFGAASAVCRLDWPNCGPFGRVVGVCRA